MNLTIVGVRLYNSSNLFFAAFFCHTPLSFPFPLYVCFAIFHTEASSFSDNLFSSSKRLPPAVCLSSSDTREKEWCNMVSVHVNHPWAFTWRLEENRRDACILKPPSKPIFGSGICPYTIYSFANHYFSPFQMFLLSFLPIVLLSSI